ncbi:DnaA/Hda family protein [Mycoplasmopsis citelli]|uniref:DnaA ATPase domain-containing protein n=1 Tax=Mycoplasmopsis citelli TaxID=171281 RepID=UPI002115C361|nr:DnaA/Hda family protein [Mycoplasmopsis citelli]UUD36214.1 DnaA/Hda family protein [Mycoplasmopsis citelli]
MKELIRENSAYSELDLKILTEQFKENLVNKVDNLWYSVFFEKMQVIKCEKKHIIFSNLEVQNYYLDKYKNECTQALESAVKEILGDQYVWDFINTNLEEHKKHLQETKVNQKRIKEAIKIQIQNEEINTRLTFANYVESDFNKEALRIFKSVVEQDTGVNVLYLSGKSGLGKTHLLSALINEFKSTKKSTSCIYISPFNFSTYISNLIKENDQDKISKILKYYSNVDLIVFDDFQIFAEGKKIATKNFLFNVIDKRMMLNKLTVFASEFEIKDITPLFEERLITRLRSGIQTKIHKPNKNDFKKIFVEILEKEDDLKIDVFDEESVNYIINGHSDSIRGLMGAITKLKFFKKEILNSDYVFNVVKNAFKDFVTPNKKITPEEIIERVCKYYKITSSEIYSKTRKSEIVIARHMVINLINIILNYSSTKIGHILKKDHTTILNAIKKFEKETKDMSSVKRTFDTLKAEIENN